MSIGEEYEKRAVEHMDTAVGLLDEAAAGKMVSDLRMRTELTAGVAFALLAAARSFRNGARKEGPNEGNAQASGKGGTG